MLIFSEVHLHVIEMSCGSLIKYEKKQMTKYINKHIPQAIFAYILLKKYRRRLQNV